MKGGNSGLAFMPSEALYGPKSTPMVMVDYYARKFGNSTLYWVTVCMPKIKAIGPTIRAGEAPTH